MMRRAFLIPVLLSVVLLFAACDAIPTESSLVVKADEIAVLYDQDTGALDSILAPGTYDLQLLTQGVVFYPIFWQVYTFRDEQNINDGAIGGDSIEAVTSDNAAVSVSLSLVFRVNPEAVDVVFDSWGSEDYRTGYIRPTTRRVVIDLINDYTRDDLSTLSRTELQQQIDAVLRAEFEANGFSLQLIDLVSIDIT